MSQAQALLNSLSETVPVHTHVTKDSDSHFIIDPVTRRIINSSNFNKTLIQGDHNSEILTFELDRYIDGHDMMLCNRVKVYYINIGEGENERYDDWYDVEDLQVHPDNEDKTICSWTIHRQATQYAGSLVFLVDYACVTEDGTEVYAWHTNYYDSIDINDGAGDSSSVVYEYADVLEQWRIKLFGTSESALNSITTTGNKYLSDITNAGDTQIDRVIVTGDEQVSRVENTGDRYLSDMASLSDVEQTEIEAKGAATLDTIPEDYTTTHNMADAALRRKAEAIELSKTGESIFLDDSSDSYLLGLNIFGKSTQKTSNGYQLFDSSTISTLSKGGATVTNNSDGSFTISGSGNLTAEHGNYHYYSHAETVKLLKPGTLRLSIDVDTIPKFYIHPQQNGGNLGSLSASNNKTFEVTQEMLDDTTFRLVFGFYGGSGSQIVTGTVKPMIYQNGDGTWEMFSGGIPAPNEEYPQEIKSVDNPKVYITGKNLADPNTVNKYANKTVSVMDDGYTIVVTGGSDKAYTSSTIQMDCDMLRGRKVILKADSISNTDDTAHGVVQLNIKSPGKQTLYMPISRYALYKEVNIPEDVNDIQLSLYTNNTENSLPVDNTNTIKGLGLYFADETWERYKPIQTVNPSRNLYGIPVSSGGNYLDSIGQMWIGDEIDYERGKFIQRICVKVFDGTESEWTYVSTGKTRFSIDLDNCVRHNNGSILYPMVCTHYQVKTADHLYTYGNCCAITNAQLWVSNLDFNTVEDWRNYLTSLNDSGTPLKLAYALKTPVETDLTATELQAFKALTTNATNTTIINGHKAMMKVKYVADVERYIYKNVTYKVQKLDVILQKSKWTESSDKMYYSQVLDLNVRPTSRIDMHPTPLQLISLINDGISMFLDNENGVVTAYAIGGTPGADMTIRATETVVVYA